MTSFSFRIRNCKTEYIIFLPFLYPRDAQGLALALTVTPGSTQQSTWDAGDSTQI